jgi:hypothetical protein
MTPDSSVPIAEHSPPTPPKAVLSSPSRLRSDRTDSEYNQSPIKSRDRTELIDSAVAGKIAVAGATSLTPPPPAFLHPLKDTVRRKSSNSSLAVSILDEGRGVLPRSTSSEVPVYPLAPLDKKGGHDPLNRQQPAPNQTSGVTKTQSSKQTQESAPNEEKGVFTGMEKQQSSKRTGSKTSPPTQIPGSSSNVPMHSTQPMVVSPQQNEATGAAQSGEEENCSTCC